MRTTLDVDDDVYLAVKERARRERRSAGSVLSELARRSLVGSPDADELVSDEFFGFRPLPQRGAAVTSELVERLLDEE